ncbi:MAG: YbaY family lipoprotein [Fimbriimonadaceae bacterium]|nr:YbaY family lipoprotein [Fimbriimonadaceae bacterium]
MELSILSSVALLSVVSNPQGAAPRPAPASLPMTVTVDVSYVSRVALTASAVVTVSLDRFDSTGQVNLSSVTLRPQGQQVPFRVMLPYTKAAMRAGATYGVRAEISDGGRTRFETARHGMVISNGAMKVSLRLVAAAAPTAFAWKGIEWELLAIDGKAVELDGKRPTILFETALPRFRAYTAVNSLSGQYSVSGGSAQLDPGPMTLMAGSDERMRLENRIVDHLRMTNRLGVMEGELVLMRGKKELLRYRKKPAMGGN